ncbi:hypothetical protein RP20_CCG028306 [Aedes albopictus]|nr:hypothetical protein RP20_CCG028306 [Aedes albopictus]
MPLRFRHLDTMVRLTASRRNSATGGGSSPSPEGENGIVLARSPKRSPIMVRRRGASPSKQSSDRNGPTNK